MVENTFSTNLNNSDSILCLRDVESNNSRCRTNISEERIKCPYFTNYDHINTEELYNMFVHILVHTIIARQLKF